MRTVGRVLGGVRLRCVVNGTRRAKGGCGPGYQKKMSRVAASAAAFGKLFQLRFGDCAFYGKAFGESAENMERRKDSYELEHGFKRSSSRLRQGGPGASVFFPDTPSCCVDPAWMLYEMFQDKWIVRHIAPRSSRMYEAPPDEPELRGSPRGSGFALQNAARARASLQLLVFMWSLPTAPPGNKVMVTNKLTSSRSVYRR